MKHLLGYVLAALLGAAGATGVMFAVGAGVADDHTVWTDGGYDDIDSDTQVVVRDQGELEYTEEQVRSHLELELG